MTLSVAVQRVPFEARCSDPACGRRWTQSEEWAPASVLQCECGAFAELYEVRPAVIRRPLSLAYIESVLDGIRWRTVFTDTGEDVTDRCHAITLLPGGRALVELWAINPVDGACPYIDGPDHVASEEIEATLTNVERQP